MLAHLKAKHRELNLNNNANTAPDDLPAAVAPSSSPTAEEFYSPEDKNDTQVTCDVLCSLSASYPAGMESMAGMECMESPESSITGCGEKRKSKSTCPKQHQLPMFLSSKLALRSLVPLFFRDGVVLSVVVGFVIIEILFLPGCVYATYASDRNL
jgi:hypothetical protein